MNIIFLDIDGVLTSDYSISIRENSELDVRCAQFLFRALRDIPDGVSIVITSSLRLGFDSCYEFMSQDKLLNLQFIFRYIHPDWKVSDKSLPRGQLIKEWLDDHSEVTRYLCIDDDSDFLPEQPHLITVPTSGFSYIDGVILKEFFGVKPGAGVVGHLLDCVRREKKRAEFVQNMRRHGSENHR